ncbi:hypothetical protein T4B_5277, partial [Trichinella pseudospiralis]
LRGVLTKFIFCYGVFCPIVQSTKNRFLTLHYANNDRHKGDPFYYYSKVLQISICITIIQNDAYLYGKVNGAKKVKTRMTRSKSRTVLRRTRDEK